MCMHVCMHIHCTVYMFIQANIHSVYSGLLVLTWNVISASDSHDCACSDSVMQELLLGGDCTKVCLGTKEAEMKLKVHAQVKSQYTSIATPFSVLPTGGTAMPVDM